MLKGGCAHDRSRRNHKNHRWRRFSPPFAASSPTTMPPSRRRGGRAAEGGAATRAATAANHAGAAAARDGYERGAAERAVTDAFDGPVEEESSDILDLDRIDDDARFRPGAARAATEPASSCGSGSSASAPPQFRKIEGFSDVGFDEGGKAPASLEAPPRSEPAALRFRSESGSSCRGDQCRSRFRLQRAGADRAGAECAHPRRSGARDAPPDAQIVARRQPARHGRAPGAGRDRARGARTLVPVFAFLSSDIPKRRGHCVGKLVRRRRAVGSLARRPAAHAAVPPLPPDNLGQLASSRSR